MWKLVGGMSLALCLFAGANDTPRKPSVVVECCGRLRNGVVAIGGESTGTTITFNRVVWELQLHDDAAREFAKEHHRKPVIVTGTLRKITGIEAKVRWIIDVSSLSDPDPTTDRKEGTRLAVRGTLRAADPRTDDSPEMTIDAGGQTWPLDLTSDARLQVEADSLVGQPVLLTGSLEHVTKEESRAPAIIRVKTLKRSTNLPIQGQSD